MSPFICTAGQWTHRWTGHPIRLATLFLLLLAACQSEEPNTGAGAGEPVSDVRVLIDPSTAADYEGRTVQLTDVQVQEVIGDSTFWIGPSGDQRLLVVLNEQRTPNTPVEGRYDINAGQTISLSGTLRALPAADSLTQWGLDETARTALQNQRLYLRAQRASGVPESAPGPGQ